MSGDEQKLDLGRRKVCAMELRVLLKEIGSKQGSYRSYHPLFLPSVRQPQT